MLLVTALGEGGTGLALVAVPSWVVALLLGIGSPAPEALVVSRVTGGALVALAVACWAVRNELAGPCQNGVLAAVLAYDGVAAAALTLAGAADGLVGIVLWPAVAAHAALGGWCVLCLRFRELTGGTGPPPRRPSD